MPEPDVESPSARWYCSFCLRPDTEVAKLVAGPGVYICSDCVALCHQVIEGEVPGPDGRDGPVPRVAPWERETTLEGALASLPRVASAGAQVEENLVQWVRRARALRATWARIGEALGMTRQSAWERFSGEE